MSFSAAAENLANGARNGIDARVYWPGMGQVSVTELMLRRLLPLAWEGLSMWAVDSADAERLLGIIEQRCLTGRNGATWQTAMVAALSDRDGVDRPEALRLMTQRYIELMHTNQPAHTWPDRP
jgi:hypothetical protein